MTLAPEPIPLDETAASIEAEVRSHWDNVLSDAIRRRIAARHGVNLEEAYELYAVEHREVVTRRRRRRTQRFAYYDFDIQTGTATCPHCAWCGPTRDIYEVTDELLVVECPACGDLLITVELPWPDQVRAAAEAGNPRAFDDMKVLVHVERRSAKAMESGLTQIALPDLSGAQLDFEWDQVCRDGEEWTILRHAGREIGQEPCFYGGQARFDAVRAALEQRYGARFGSLKPTPRSRTYLFGDYVANSSNP